MPYKVHETVPDGLCVAFYKGTQTGINGIYSRLARYVDAGIYSHTELILPDIGSASSSFMDGGVRVKQIGYSSVGDWDFLPIPDYGDTLRNRALNWYCQHEGQKYDVMGNLRFGSNLFSHDKEKWFCSESNAEALGFIQGFRYGPNGLLALLSDVYRTKLVTVERR